MWSPFGPLQKTLAEMRIIGIVFLHSRERMILNIWPYLRWSRWHVAEYPFIHIAFGSKDG